MTETTVEAVKACPTMGGDMMGYTIEFTSGLQKEWKEVSLRRSMPEHGIPNSGTGKGVTDDLGLLTYEQAQALAWTLLAKELAYGDYLVEVRLVPYRIKYDLKAWRMEENAITFDRR